MKLTSDQVQKVAKLANVPTTPDEIDLYADQLSKILDYIAQLEAVNTENILPTFNVSSEKIEVVIGHDEKVVGDFLTSDLALQNAPLKKDGLFVTKGVFENE